MGRQKKSTVIPGVEIHDHFDGSFYCIECGGQCRLTGGNLAATMLVRSMFEAMAYRSGYWLSGSDEYALQQCGVDIEKFKQRANAAVARASNAKDARSSQPY